MFENEFILWLLFSHAALVMVSIYAIWLRLNLWRYTQPRGYRGGRGEPYRRNENSEDSGSGGVMFFILLLLIIYGVWFIYALYAG